MLGLSAFEVVLFSIGVALSTVPVPEGTTGAAFSRGTVETCTAQGFFIVFGYGAINYTSSLALYYLLIIRFNKSKAWIAKWWRWRAKESTGDTSESSRQQDTAVQEESPQWRAQQSLDSDSSRKLVRTRQVALQAIMYISTLFFTLIWRYIGGIQEKVTGGIPFGREYYAFVLSMA